MLDKWAFYWQQLLTPEQALNVQKTPKYISTPNSWSNLESKDGKSFPVNGYATYQTLIKIPKDAPRLAIESQYISSNCRIYINDELVVQNGDVGISPERSSYYAKPIFHIIDNVQDSF